MFSRTNFVLTTLASVCLGAFTPAQEVSIRTSRLFDGYGRVLENQTIRVKDGTIVAVTDQPDDAGIDLTGLTVLPGIIDTHTHFAWHFDPDGKLHDAGPEAENAVESTFYALENAYITLLSGVTTMQSMGSPDDKLVRDWIARGTLPGPRILTSLRPITGQTGSPEQMRATVRERKAEGADLIKIFASESIRTGGGPTLTQEQLDAACGEARALGLRTAVHAHGPESAQRAVRAGCTAIEHGALLDETTLRLMAEHGTFYDPNIGLIFQNYFENESRYLGIGGYTAEGFQQMRLAVPKALDTFKKALEIPKLKIVFGTDAVAGAHGRNVEELIYRVEQGGQSAADAIVSATSLAAESLGMGQSIGSVTPGKKADLIAVEGNPLTDIRALRKVVFVMKEGSVYRGPVR